MDERAYSASSYPAQLAYLNDALLFSVENSDGGAALWRTDGTANGTQLVKSGLPILRGPITPLANSENAIFSAYADQSGIELWQTDGTALGTMLLQDIAPGPASSNTGWFETAGSKIFFVANDGVHGQELWALRAPLGNGATKVFLPLVQR